jgi:hypothetical protein
LSEFWHWRLAAAMGYYCNARFDGVIDLHFVKAVGTYEPLLDLLVTVIVTAFYCLHSGNTATLKPD